MTVAEFFLFVAVIFLVFSVAAGVCELLDRRDAARRMAEHHRRYLLEHPDYRGGDL